jgi:hypothetical protein
MNELNSNFMDEYRAGAKQLSMLSGRIMHTVGSHVEHINFKNMAICTSARDAEHQRWNNDQGDIAC